MHERKHCVIFKLWSIASCFIFVFKVMLLNAIKDVASSLVNMLDSAKNASAAKQSEGTGEELKASTKVG